MSSKIFVFGSNLAGRHGRGSALEARLRHGAIYGCGTGLQGGSYAIPTKDHRLRILPLEQIAGYVTQFLDFARACPNVIFEVVPIGCGLAGYTPQQIAPLFRGASINVQLPAVFMEWCK